MTTIGIVKDYKKSRSFVAKVTCVWFLVGASQIATTLMYMVNNPSIEFVISNACVITIPTMVSYLAIISFLMLLK